MQFPVQQFPILTPGQMNPYNQVFQSGLDSYKGITEASYLPQTLQANVNSKNTYSNLMGPQYIAKLFGNPEIMANVPEEMRQPLLQHLINQGTLSSTNQQQKKEPTYLEKMVDFVKNGFTANKDEQNSPRTIQVQNYGQQTPNGITLDSSQLPLQQQQAIRSMRPGDSYTIPQNNAQQAGAQTYAQQNFQQEITPPMENPPIQQPKRTWAENVGYEKGIHEEGKQLGDIRAKDIGELDTAYASGLNNKTTFDRIANILNNPVMQEMRQLSFVGKKELGYYAENGTKEQKELIGEYLALTGNIVKDASRDFRGQFRQGEQQLLEGMKPTASDMFDVASGKMQTLMYLNNMMTERSKIASKLIRENHMNKGVAMEYADKMVNGESIRKQVKDQLHPTITLINQKTGEKKTVTAAEARKMGVKNV